MTMCERQLQWQYLVVTSNNHQTSSIDWKHLIFCLVSFCIRAGDMLFFPKAPAVLPCPEAQQTHLEEFQQFLEQRESDEEFQHTKACASHVSMFPHRCCILLQHANEKSSNVFSVLGRFKVILHGNHNTIISLLSARSLLSFPQPRVHRP